ncbi:MAG: IscS subfamily cysteine desulfurase [Deferribacteraceae bacterium]|jgi:cysteine desulfurase|nr:IscS subfamily cysteine desulfurase [Deferribacteraceae bacterium]
MSIYFDNAATTVCGETAAQAVYTAMKEVYGNPSSVHRLGQKAAVVLDRARSDTAKVLNCEAKEVYFTSGGTEADNWAIRSAARTGALKGKKHIISSKFEHHAVLHTLNALEKEGFEVTLLDVYSDGLVRVDDLADAVREDTALVTIMYANNEIGTVQPVAEIGALCRLKGVIFHTDAVQAVGHIPVDVKRDNVDMLSLSAHKFHGPKGVGALYVRQRTPLNIFIEGGAQERGKRGGTENVPGVSGLAAALTEANERLEENAAKTIAIRERLVNALLEIPKSRYNGDPTKRLPGIINFCFEGIEGESLLLKLDAAGICASSGSACTSGSLDPSHVLLAIGLSHEVAHGSLRLSFNERNSVEEADFIIKTLPTIIEKLRSMSPVWEKIQKGGK